MAEETRRGRQRRLLVDDIVAEARALLNNGGPTAVSLRAIARSLGMSAPSLYTYFPSLGDLFTELIVQSYDALASEVASSLARHVDAPLEERLMAGPAAYRTWALANRQQFNLIFFDQISGYEAPPEGPTIEAQTAVLRPIAADYAQARGWTVDVLLKPGGELSDFLGWWATFHGLVVLEVNHHLDWVDAAEVFERRMQSEISRLIA